MTNDQRTVLWLGLMLIGLNIVLHISEIKSVIFSGSGTPGNWASTANKAAAGAAAAAAAGANALKGKTSSATSSNLGNPPNGTALA